jgi:hypothetical protein
MKIAFPVRFIVTPICAVNVAWMLNALCPAQVFSLA